jgi:hypothetical protein
MRYILLQPNSFLVNNLKIKQAMHNINLLQQIQEQSHSNNSKFKLKIKMS